MKTPGAAPTPVPADAPVALMTGAELQGRAIRGVLLTALHIIVSTPLGIVSSVILARLLHPAGYGTLAYLGVTFGIAQSVAELGFGYGVIQWGAVFFARSEEKETASLIRAFTGFRVLVQLPILLVVGVFLLRSEAPWQLAVFIPSTVAYTFVSGATAVLSLQNRTATLAKLAIASNVVMQAAVVSTAVLLPHAAAIWVARGAAALAMPLLALLVIGPRARRAVLYPRLPVKMPHGFWRFTFGMFGAGILTLLVFSRSEVFVLKFYRQDLNLGEFALAFGLSQALTGPVDAMLGPLLPASAALLAEHRELVSRALLRGLRFSCFLSGALMAGLLPAVFYLVPIVFGAQFAPAALLFLPLGIISTLQSAWNPANALLMARRRAILLLVISAVALSGDVLVAVLAIPSLGAWGAVIANVVGQVLPVALFAYFELRFENLSFGQGLAASRAWLLGLLALGFALAGAGALPGAAHVARPAVAFALGVAAYAVLIRLGGGVLEGSDQAVFTSALPGPMGTMADSALRAVGATR